MTKKHICLFPSLFHRHRGVISLYDFSEDATVQDNVLPICRSNYVEESGYNYNIGLSMPYDALSHRSTS